MAASLARRWVRNKLAVPKTEIGAGLLVAPTPSAQADHFIVGRPLGEGVVRGMHGDEAASVPDKLCERVLSFPDPRFPVVIGNEDAILGEIRLEHAHVPAFGRRGGDIHFEQPVLLQNLHEHRGGRFPIMIVLSIDDQGLESGANGGRGRERDQNEKGDAFPGLIAHRSVLFQCAIPSRERKRWQWLSCGLAEFSRRVLTLTAPGLGFAIRSRSESRGTLLVFGRAPGERWSWHLP